MVKSRISKDPNNHRWLKDETTFGQRILRSHGWTPGAFLGAVDAPHAPLHGAANASYIRVLLKEDAGGLGYRPGGGSGENDIAGIDEVKDIFARLNGKVETEEEKRERERKKAMVYLGQRVGGITFVRGGLLVQDGLDLIETSTSNRSANGETPETTSDLGENTMANLGKRKAEDEPADESEDEAPRKKRRKDNDSRAEKKRRKEEKKKRKEKKGSDAEQSTESSALLGSLDTKAAKKTKKKNKQEDEAESSRIESAIAKKDKKERKEKKKSLFKTTDAQESSTELSDREDAAESKKDKKTKKGKKEKKEKKKKSKSDSEGDSIQTTNSIIIDSSTTTITNTPAESGTSTPTGLSKGRHIHHARRVAAKRAAMLDAAALKQILAI
ncbi:hypothetical protein jhhlp_007260 [Lomentospora prolificans]|uniref:PinX1-related protein 1 n=1 Tax=Lomentospora prolificans TaxID=41688 RepID=A0A2N3N275_9PEZI|nr:hypothetical protein jhhlp_007260 [Lomentospora prolificans]